MRILTWNVNVLRTVLDYHPFSSMPNKTVEGLLDYLEADICCFQEHKTRRAQFDRSMACPGMYDAFWAFPRSKTGYSGVCTYVNSRVCVPLRAEEGITGLLLSDLGGTMKPPWTVEEKIGHYPDVDDVQIDEEVDGSPFNVTLLDTEGRAVVLDFGLFVLFNLYCPNETNEQRRPYKMNFLRMLQARVEALVAAGREVIIAGDINVMRQPIDSGEGGVKTTAEQHYEHPARVWLDNWCAPKGPMVDVVRESWPDREGMFTCWNMKIDARPANYGSRIDLILCTPGLRPWIKGGDIQAKVFGSDHCPVYIDLHDSIKRDGETIHLRDLLDPPDRPPSTGTVFPWDPPREAPQPPRFATKFMEEFSTKQRTLKSLWANAKPTPKAAKKVKSEDAPTPPRTASESNEATEPEEPSTTMGVARAAFKALDSQPSSSTKADMAAQIGMSQPSQSSTSETVPPRTGRPRASEKRSQPETIDLTLSPPAKKAALERTKSASAPKGKVKRPAGGQAKLAAFWTMPAKAKPKELSTSSFLPAPFASSSSKASPSASPADKDEPPDTLQDELLAQALADEDAEQDAERERVRKAKNDVAAPQWANMFAPKKAPLCTVHNHPCKDFIVKVPGPNKGKRFWLCSMPVGPGYDMGKSKRPREDVDNRYRCNFFLWDSANSLREAPRTIGGMVGTGGSEGAHT